MDMTNLTLITLAFELHKEGILIGNIAQRLGKHRETIGLWLQEIEHLGLEGFLNQYEKAKKVPRVRRQIDPLIKRWIWDIREREIDCCGEKIGYFLQQEHQIKVANSKIYEVLAEKYQLRSKWKKNTERGLVPKAQSPREVVQMDSIDFGGVFAFTGIDIFTREADILLAPQLTARYGYQFLEQSMGRRFDRHVHLIQTDGGPEFKEEFKQNVASFWDRHRVARPYKKNEQSFIESFNRTVRKECLGWIKYKTNQIFSCKKMVESFLDRYHYHRPHMGLGIKTPLTVI